MTRVFYKEAVAALIVFDVTRPITFDSVMKWKSDIDSKVTVEGTGKPIPVILCANKVDLSSNMENLDLGQFAKDHGFCAWFETSAKDGRNLDNAVPECLVNHIFESLSVVNEKEEKPPVTDASGIVTLSKNSNSENTTGCSGC
eukprot:TRINITY_DN1399_c0_g1_i2.p1 TRINITY_DN1399_c0_g1~~TRINITY_DN1399_c0_g1_i2.p1  ORF type:complete len:143 (+),score=27.21 TRINITY_DN1399_c0_g1_i2:50-478(+)